VAQIHHLLPALDRPLSDAGSIRAAGRTLDSITTEVTTKTQRIGMAVRRGPALPPPRPLTERDWKQLAGATMHPTVREVIDRLRDNHNKGVDCTSSRQTKVNAMLLASRLPYRLLKKRRVAAETDFEGGRYKLYHVIP
jgi:hypothetical protein